MILRRFILTRLVNLMLRGIYDLKLNAQLNFIKLDEPQLRFILDLRLNTMRTKESKLV